MFALTTNADIIPPVHIYQLFVLVSGADNGNWLVVAKANTSMIIIPNKLLNEPDKNGFPTSSLNTPLTAPCTGNSEPASIYRMIMKICIFTSYYD